MDLKSKLKDVIESILQRHFKSFKVLDIDIEEDVGFMEDEILRVRVIFEGQVNTDMDVDDILDIRQTFSRGLEDVEYFNLPVYSFIDNAEMGKDKIAI